MKKMNKKNVYGYISTICCMIAAFWIAILGELLFVPWCWVIYTIGGITGIIHLYKRKDKSTMLMYTTWTIFDILAIVRLII